MAACILRLAVVGSDNDRYIRFLFIFGEAKTERKSRLEIRSNFEEKYEKRLLIFSGTVVLRLSLFPLVIKTQKNNAALGNNMPQLTRLQAEMTQARQEGDQLKGLSSHRYLTISIFIAR